MIGIEELLTKFKNRMKISHNIEDDALKDILEASIEDITIKCGQFDINTNNRARELVIERSRYVYNDSLEYFDDNFVSSILSLNIQLSISTIVKDGTSDEN